MTIKNFVENIINGETSIGAETVEGIIAYAYWMGREEATRKVSDDYAAHMAAQSERAKSCRYSKMAECILQNGDGHIYQPDYAGDVTRTAGAEEVKELPKWAAQTEANAQEPAGGTPEAEEAAETVEEPENVVIDSFPAYNARRYSRPWIALMVDGQYDFSERLGVYTGANDGDAGGLVVWHPVIGQVYGIGQKDYRKPRDSYKAFKKWDGTQFIDCDKLGRV